MMLTGDELKELKRRGEVNDARPHQSLFELAIN
jgi:hypothetical protein